MLPLTRLLTGGLRRVTFGLLLPALILSVRPVCASGPGADIPAATVGVPAVRPSSVQFGQIALSAPEIVLTVEDVKVTIKRDSRAQEITVSSNCPSRWNVSGNVIRQVGLSTARKGVSLSATSAGGQVTVNGKIYQLPRDSDGAIRNLKVENGVVLVNGKPLSPLPGSDKPGDCTGPDVLDVTIPDAFRGGLVLSCRGASDVNVGGWQGGSLALNLNGASTLQTGKLQGLTKAIVDVQGDGKAQIKGLYAKAFVANITGSGSVTVDSGNADLSNATISGSGKMMLKGKFKNLKKAVNGNGSIEVTD